MARECENTACSREGCEGCPSGSGAANFAAAMNPKSHVKKVIAVVSGKGGVGKSSLTALLAVTLSRQGYRTGILDADITGPSIPHLFGVNQVPGSDGESILPVETRTGIKLISVNLLLEDRASPVVWRGPVLASVIKQFWSDVIWGELDYLLVDMPPGTGDVPLTVFQSLPLHGILLVTSPQSLVEMVVEKAFHMAEMMQIPVLGIIENFSYLKCPDCGKEIPLFGKSRTEEWAKAHGLPLLLRLPLDPAISAYADAGQMEMYPGREAEQLNQYL
ncbi:MAG: Mrp/NBP35 family ATP-binding protein [Lachnospiraceae bacterium]|nr:Mrp/NBP35 family ATP-binding protein [Lachnospiraceae bacterium]